MSAQCLITCQTLKEPAYRNLKEITYRNLKEAAYQTLKRHETWAASAPSRTLR
jgi:hypothetical protein